MIAHMVGEEVEKFTSHISGLVYPSYTNAKADALPSASQGNIDEGGRFSPAEAMRL